MCNFLHEKMQIYWKIAIYCINLHLTAEMARVRVSVCQVGHGMELIIIPCDDSLRMCSAVITREYFPHVRVSVVFGEVGTVHPGRVTAALRVHEKLRVRNVPLYGAQRFRNEFLERQPRVVHPDLMATKRCARTTCNYCTKTISSQSSKSMFNVANVA